MSTLNLMTVLGSFAGGNTKPLKEEIERLTGEVESLNAQIEHLLNDDVLEDAEYERTIAELRSRVSELTTQLTAAEELAQQLQAEVERLTNEAASGADDEELAALNATVVALSEQLEEASAQLAALAERAQELKAQVKELEATIASKDAEFASTVAEKDALFASTVAEKDATIASRDATIAALQSAGSGGLQITESGELIGAYPDWKTVKVVGRAADLSGMTLGSSLCKGNTNLTEWDCDLPDATDGGSMFYGCTALTSFSGDLSSLTNAYQMFYNCNSLTSFSGDLAKLTSCTSFFSGCINLTSFTTTDLSKLTSVQDTFRNCRSLTTPFNYDLPQLKIQYSMFQGCEVLPSFSGDLSSLTRGAQMFNSCYALTSFTTTNLLNLTNGDEMFRNCKSLTSFNYTLPSLTTGTNMFQNCKLDRDSAIRILSSIPSSTSNKNISLGILAFGDNGGLTGNASTISTSVVRYDLSQALAAATAKKWTVSVVYKALEGNGEYYLPNDKVETQEEWEARTGLVWDEYKSTIGL